MEPTSTRSGFRFGKFCSTMLLCIFFSVVIGLGCSAFALSSYGSAGVSELLDAVSVPDAVAIPFPHPAAQSLPPNGGKMPSSEPCRSQEMVENWGSLSFKERSLASLDMVRMQRWRVSESSPQSFQRSPLAFGSNCSWPATNLNKTIRSFYRNTSWNTCGGRPLPAVPFSLVEVIRVIKPREKVEPEGFDRKHGPYGCWFYLAPGSGVWLNVGRLLVLNGLEGGGWGSEVFNFPQARPFDSSHKDGRGGQQRQLCTVLLANGFESAMMDSGAWGRPWHREKNVGPPEFVLCTGECVTRTSHSPCPGQQLYNSRGLPCRCDVNSEMLSCAAERGAQRASRARAGAI